MNEATNSTPTPAKPVTGRCPFCGAAMLRPVGQVNLICSGCGSFAVLQAHVLESGASVSDAVLERLGERFPEIFKRGASRSGVEKPATSANDDGNPARVLVGAESFAAGNGEAGEPAVNMVGKYRTFGEHDFLILKKAGDCVLTFGAQPLPDDIVGHAWPVEDGIPTKLGELFEQLDKGDVIKIAHVIKDQCAVVIKLKVAGRKIIHRRPGTAEI